MMRVALFLGTNIAVLALATIVMRVLGVENYLHAQGIGVQLQGMLIWAALIGMGGSFISLLISKWTAKLSTRAKVIDGNEGENERWLVQTVGELARQANIGMPEVAVFPADQPNAFATGATRNSALVAVSTGLLANMRPEEVKAVLGHEIGHVANGDMVTLTLIQGVLNTFVFFLARVIGMVVDRAISRDDRSGGIGYFLTTMVAQIVLGILASMIVMWFSRRREFRADAAGAKLAGRNQMIGALERLKIGARMPDQMPQTLTAFGISSGVRRNFAQLFASHPPLDDRIAALRAAA
jgi:heat shock protein HtpX